MAQRFTDDTPDELVEFTYRRQSQGGYFDAPDYKRGTWFGWVLLALFVALLAISFTPTTILMELLK